MFFAVGNAFLPFLLADQQSLSAHSLTHHCTHTYTDESNRHHQSTDGGVPYTSCITFRGTSHSAASDRNFSDFSHFLCHPDRSARK